MLINSITYGLIAKITKMSYMILRFGLHGICDIIMNMSAKRLTKKQIERIERRKKNEEFFKMSPKEREEWLEKEGFEPISEEERHYRLMRASRHIS